MKYAVVRRLHFCYGHRLMDYEGKCSRAHGHNGILELELRSDELDEHGMVFDFVEIKRRLMEFIDGELDHRMLLRGDDPMVVALEAIGEKVFTMKDNPTAENIARLIYREARDRGLPIAAVRLWETPDAFAEYRPD